jgi:signal transduction histidine kinase
MRFSRWSLGARVTALAVGVALLLGVIAITAAVTAATNQSEVTRLVERIGPAHTNSERLMTALVTEQSGLRDYALSGVFDDLTAYNNGVAEENTVGAATEQVLAHEPELLARLRAARVACQAWRTAVAVPLIASVQANGPTTGDATAAPPARQRFQEAVAAVIAFQNDATAARDRLRGDARRTSDRLIGLLIVAAVVVVLAAAAVGVLLRRLVTGPVIQLAAEIRQVVGGDYEHEIRSNGPPEVAALADDVNAMRRKIATDLAEVREARVLIEEANRQLEEQAEELTRSNRDLEQFAYVASHDLQEPLRKVASFCQLLQRRYAGQLDERADQYIYFAVDGAQRMQRLINDLLAFSRIGRVTSGFTDVDLNRLAADAAAQLEAAREYASGEIIIDPLPTVRGEEPLLTALLTNLLSNSLKFRDPQRRPQVRLSAERDGEYWEISCTDNGIGIPTEFADKVFVIFQRLHPKDAYPGTGIGLSIAKKIIEYHGGRIWIDHDHAPGTRIRFTLPVAVEPLPDPVPVPTPAEEYAS